MIKVKLKDILNAGDVLKKLSKTAMPIKTSYAIAKLMNRINEEFGIYEKERIELLEKYGTLNEEKTEYIFETSEKRLSFQKDHSELIDVEVEIDVKPITLSAADNIRISAQEILSLGAFVEVVDVE